MRLPTRMFDSLARCARELTATTSSYTRGTLTTASPPRQREKREGLLRPFTKTQWMAMHGK